MQMMKGLFIKDILVLRQQWVAYAMMSVMWLVFGFMNESVAFFAGIMTMFTVTVPLNSIAYDEKARWDKYALAMPIKRETLVLSKYLLAAATAAVVFVLSGVVGVVMGEELTESLMVSVGCMLSGMVIVSIILPLIFKFGVEKGRLMIFVVAFLPAAAIFIISKLHLQIPKDMNMDGLLFIFVAAAALVVAVSAMISMNIGKNKEYN